MSRFHTRRPVPVYPHESTAISKGFELQTTPELTVRDTRQLFASIELALNEENGIDDPFAFNRLRVIPLPESGGFFVVGGRNDAGEWTKEMRLPDFSWPDPPCAYAYFPVDPYASACTDRVIWNYEYPLATHPWPGPAQTGISWPGEQIARGGWAGTKADEIVFHARNGANDCKRRHLVPVASDKPVSEKRNAMSRLPVDVYRQYVTFHCSHHDLHWTYGEMVAVRKCFVQAGFVCTLPDPEEGNWRN
jgi:hypothetical protein